MTPASSAVEANLHGSERRRVVVVGAGFGGFQAASELGRRYLPRWADVTMIDRRDSLLFTPLLYEAATGVIQTRRLEYPVSHTLERQGVRFCVDTVTGVDLAARRVQTTGGPVPYDFLILAGGSRANFYGRADFASFTLPLKTSGDADRIYAHVRECIHRAETSTEAERRTLLTFAVVGAGPTGVELAASLQQALQERLLPHRWRKAGVTRVLLVEARQTVLQGMPSRLGSAVAKELAKEGIEILVGRPVASVTPGGLVLGGPEGASSLEAIPAATVVWTAGICPALPPGLDRCAAAPDGRIIVDEFLSLPDATEVSIVGDMAAAPSGAGLAPANAPAAIQMGKLAARNVTRRLLGLQPIPFRYAHEGELVSLGRHNAAAYLGSRVFTGRNAWLLRRAVYVTNLMGMRNRLGLAVDWARNEKRGRRANQEAYTDPGDDASETLSETLSETRVMSGAAKAPERL